MANEVYLVEFFEVIPDKPNSTPIFCHDARQKMGYVDAESVEQAAEKIGLRKYEFKGLVGVPGKATLHHNLVSYWYPFVLEEEMVIRMLDHGEKLRAYVVTELKQLVIPVI